VKAGQIAECQNIRVEETGRAAGGRLAGVIDIEKECRKAKTELEKLDVQLSALASRLSNPGFTDRAPAHVVEAERSKLGEWTSRRSQLSEKVISLCGS
jgi:valyl-tRNA synthetase